MTDCQGNILSFWEERKKKLYLTALLHNLAVSGKVTAMGPLLTRMAVAIMYVTLHE